MSMCVCECDENALPGNSLAIDDGQQEIFVSVVTAAQQLPKFLPSEEPWLRQKEEEEETNETQIIYFIYLVHNSRR